MCWQSTGLVVYYNYRKEREVNTMKGKIIEGLAIAAFFGVCILINLLLDNYTDWLFNYVGL